MYLLDTVEAQAAYGGVLRALREDRSIIGVADTPYNQAHEELAMRLRNEAGLEHEGSRLLTARRNGHVAHVLNGARIPTSSGSLLVLGHRALPREALDNLLGGEEAIARLREADEKLLILSYGEIPGADAYIGEAQAVPWLTTSDAESPASLFSRPTQLDMAPPEARKDGKVHGVDLLARIRETFERGDYIPLLESRAL